MKSIRLLSNSVTAKLLDPTDEIKKDVTELLSYLVDGAERSFGFNANDWSGRSSFYNLSNDSFPAGFVFTVQAHLEKSGIKVQLLRKPHVQPAGPESPIVDEFGNDNPDYDFQMRALRQIEKHGRGIIRVATGGGKSKIAMLVMARWKKRTLFLTTRGILMHQMADQLRDIGITVGQIGAGTVNFVDDVNVGMVQTFIRALDEPFLDVEKRALIRSFKKKKGPKTPDSEISRLAKERFREKTNRRNTFLKFLQTVDVVIGEEAHEAGGTSYFNILQHCKNASIRVALTATPFMKDSAEDNLRLMAAFGPVLINVTEENLIAKGILATPHFKFVDCSPSIKLRRSSPYPRCVSLGYTHNPYMHADIISDALKAKKYNLPVLALVKFREQGEVILEKYIKAGLRAVFINGDSKQNWRKECLVDLGRGVIDVLIGTTIVDVGVDVPAIALVQLIGGGKAEVALRQRIGRGLRRKKGISNHTFIADYSCNMNHTLKKHYLERLYIVESTPGFAENILPAGQDFDWSIFKDNK